MEPIITYNETFKFWKISAPQGYVLSGWTESQDIKDYNDFSSACLPENAELSEIECIPLDKAEEYRKQRDVAIESESDEN